MAGDLFLPLGGFVLAVGLLNLLFEGDLAAIKSALMVGTPLIIIGIIWQVFR